ncbi:MAG: hypothetical protein L3J12_02185 [Spirochaetales bacterium]|nr:hypothetical protein [Spirochaetales bacterium]
MFFRAGKQSVNWGVGRFFSPGDLLSLSRIDQEDPDADLDGPVAVKVNYPFMLNNFYLYTIIPVEADSYSDIAFAPKVEFVIGNSEIAFGAYYQYNHAPDAMATISSAIGDVSLYGEGYLSYGSDKTFVIDNGGVTAVSYNDKIFFKGTIGAGYSWSDDFANYNFSFSGQYYYNGEGYDDPYTLQELGSLLGSGVISSSDLLENGRHYGAGSVSWRDMWGSDFSLSLFFIENFSSLSGMIKPSFSWSGMDNIDITLSAPRIFGDPGEEYSVQGSTASVSLGVSIGGTSF